MSRASATWQRLFWPALFAALFIVQAPLWLNPGYFSHDELQWGAYADVASLAEMRWVGWTQVEAFQYRPLTFNLWQVISYFLFEWPFAFHALFVILGTLNALALAALVRRDLGTAASALAAFAFVLSPYAAYVHGWVATLADLLWVGALLACLHAVRAVEHAGRPSWMVVLTVAPLTVVALLAKEAALSIPALLALVWWLSGWRRIWRVAMLASALPALIYLVLRISVILYAPRSGDSYAWSLSSIPWRSIEYLVYPWLRHAFEVGNTLPFLTVKAAATQAIALLALFVVALARTHPRLLLAFFVGGLLSLGPVLLLTASASQYGYGLAAVIAVCVAFVWRHGSTWSRALLALPLLVMAMHGVQVQLKMLEVGRIQVQLYANLMRELEQPETSAVHIFAERDEWIYRRLTHNIPSYMGVPIQDRVSMVEDPARATHRALQGGRLVRVESRWQDH
jgi:hypothetical protein